MQPTIFGLHPFTVVTPLAIALGLFATLRVATRAGIPLGRLFLLQGLVAAAGLAGAKVLFVLEEGVPLGSALVALGSGSVTGAYRYAGGLVAALAVGLVAARRLLPGVAAGSVLDALAIGAGVAMSVVRVQCLLLGCCTGTVCHHAWCLEFPRPTPPWLHHLAAGWIASARQTSLPVHPLSLYFATASLAATGLAAGVLRRRRRYDGQAGLWFLALHEGSKALLESMRSPYVATLQVASATLALLALCVLAAVDLRIRALRRVYIDVPAQPASSRAPT